jgi:hypothetical protein
MTVHAPSVSGSAAAAIRPGGTLPTIARAVDSFRCDRSKIISLSLRRAAPEAARMSSPRIDKLFHVLVVLGASSATGCDDGAPAPDPTVDAAAQVSSPDASPADPDAGSSALLPCLCSTEVCCDRSGAAPVLQSGFECCWSTTCD